MLAAAALQNPFLALLGLAVIVLAILVVITYIIRVAALVVLAAAAPPLLIGHTLPQTERYARAWWRAMPALLVAPACAIAAAGRGVPGAAHERWRPRASDRQRLHRHPGRRDLLYFLFKVPFWMLHATFSGAETRAITQAKRIGSAVTKAVSAA